MFFGIRVALLDKPSVAPEIESGITFGNPYNSPRVTPANPAFRAARGPVTRLERFKKLDSGLRRNDSVRLLESDKLFWQGT
jgi:hypothetical protein